MKKIITLLAAVVIVLGFNSCQKTKDNINKLVEFDIDYSTNVAVPSASVTSTATTTQTLNIETPEIPTEASSKFSDNKTSKDLISEIKMTKFNISTTAANLDFLKSISIYIKASGQPEQLIAQKITVPTGVTSVAADMQDVNIKGHISSDKISFRLGLLVQAGGSGSQNLKLDQTVRVKGSLIK